MRINIPETKQVTISWLHQRVSKSMNNIVSKDVQIFLFSMVCFWFIVLFSHFHITGMGLCDAILVRVDQNGSARGRATRTESFALVRLQYSRYTALWTSCQCYLVRLRVAISNGILVSKILNFKSFNVSKTF